MITIVGVVLVSFYAGRYSALKPYRDSSMSIAKGISMKEGLLKYSGINKQIDPANDFRHVFFKESSLEDMGNYSWALPAALTPFVITGPLPGKSYNAEINKAQFRSADEVIMPKPAGEFRIFLTGGSTAYSSGAPSQDSAIGGYLLSYLKGKKLSVDDSMIKVYTMAYQSWVSTHERIMIENRLSEMEPDLVISLSGFNDCMWSWGGYNTLWLYNFTDLTVLGMLNLMMEQNGYPKMPDLSDKSEGRIKPEIVAERVRKNVELSSFVLSMRNVRYVYFLQPIMFMSKKGLSQIEKKIYDIMPKEDRDYYAACFEEIKRSLADYKADNFTFVDLNSMFDNIPENNTIFIDHVHFGDKGNKMIAKEILECLLMMNKGN